MIRAMKQRKPLNNQSNQSEGTILNSLPIGLLVFDEDVRLVNANSYIFKTFNMNPLNPEGYRFGDIFRCKHVLKVGKECGSMPACAGCTLVEAIKEVLRTGESKTGVEVVNDFEINNRLTTKWFSVNISSVSEGMRRFAMAAFTDITTKRRAEQELSGLGLSDELTGLYTRRYLFKKLDELIQLEWPEAFPVSIALIDIDRSEQIGRQYDGDIREFMMKGLADILKNYTRNTDMIGRYGDDEFIVVFTKLDAKDASEIITKMMAAFSEKMKERITGPATFSTGLIAVDKVTGSVSDVNDYIRDAEALLIQAKQKGYNRIEREQEA